MSQENTPKHSHDHDLRSHDAELRDAVNAVAGPAQPDQIPENHAANVETRADLSDAGTIVIPDDEHPELADNVEEDEGGEDELQVISVKVEPRINIFLRCFDSPTLRRLVEIGKINVDTQCLNLVNPLAKPRMLSGREQTQEIGFLRQPVARAFKLVGAAVNQTYAVLGSPENIERYLNHVFDKVNDAISTQVYDSTILVGSAGETVDVYDMVRVDVDMVNIVPECDDGNEQTVVHVNVSLDVQVPLLMSQPHKAENIIRNYAKFLTAAANRAGIQNVSVGVVFDVANFTNSGEEYAPFETFRTLVTNEGVNKVKAVIAAGDNHDYLFATHTGGNTIVLLSGEPESQESENEAE